MFADIDPKQSTPFTFGERLGIVFVVQSACLSAIAVTGCLLYIGYSAVKIKRGASRRWSTSTHVHWYFLNLLISDLIQAIGAIISVKWVIHAGVKDGPLCVAQGILKQMGDVGVALTTFVITMTIAIHTFCIFVFHWNSPSATAILVLMAIWIFIFLIVGVSMMTHRGQSYYGNTQYWCWITDRYSVQRIVLEYLWLWLVAFANIIIYFVLSLVVKGVIVIRDGRLRLSPRNKRVTTPLASDNSRKKASDVAMQMLYYPAVYVVTVFPIAVVRWLVFTGHTVPFPATAFASILFSSSGLLNVILFKFTRPRLLPTRDITSTFDSAREVHLNSFKLTKTLGASRDHGHLDGSDYLEDNLVSGWKSSVGPTRTPKETIPPLYITHAGEPICPQPFYR